MDAELLEKAATALAVSRGEDLPAIRWAIANRPPWWAVTEQEAEDVLRVAIEACAEITRHRRLACIQAAEARGQTMDGQAYYDAGAAELNLVEHRILALINNG